MKNSKYVNLTLWANNTSLFHNIRTYLCDENYGKFYYKIDNEGETYYTHSCSYKSRGYMSFLNHIDNLIKFQKKFKVYYKQRCLLGNMLPDKLYVVSVIAKDSLPKMYMFNSKDDATDFAFNEAREYIKSDISYSEEGNYILTYKKNKITIAMHHVLSDKLSGINKACLDNSSKIVYNKPHIIDLNDSGILTAEESENEEDSDSDSDSDLELDTDRIKAIGINEESNEQIGNIYMEINSEYIDKSVDDLFNIFSFEKQDNDNDNDNDNTPTESSNNTPELQIITDQESSYNMHPRILRHTFSKLNNDVNFWDSDEEEDENNDDENNDDENDDESNDDESNSKEENGEDVENDTELSLHDFYDNYKLCDNQNNQNNQNKFTETALQVVMRQTNATKEEAEKSLIDNDGNILNAVLQLKI